MLRVVLLLAFFAGPGLVLAQQTVPFHLRNNLVSVQATINGEEVGAVLDSGTGTVIISRSLATRLGLKLGDSLQAAGGGAGDQSIFPVKLKHVEFGSLALADVPAYAIDLDSISSSSGFTVDALLGAPFFSKHVVRVDYTNSTVSIHGEGTSPACPNPIPLKLVHNVPVVVAKVKSRPGSAPRTVNLVVDLGSRHYSYLGSAFLQSDLGKTLYAGGHKRSIAVGTGGRAMGVVTTFAELAIGAQDFHDVEFALTNEIKAFDLKEIDGSLGVPLWKGGVITFDYPRHQLCIQTPHE
jgi:hypothetical protein